MAKQNKSFIRPELLKRILIYSAVILILGCTQSAFFPFLDFCPKTPDLIMGMLLAICLLDSPKSAFICAIAGGFFLDAISSTDLPLSPIIYFCFVIIISLFTQKMLKSFASFFLLMLPALVFRALATLTVSAVNARAFPYLGIFLDVILPEAVMTLIFCLPIYFIIKICTIPLQSHGKFSF